MCKKQYIILLSEQLYARQNQNFTQNHGVCRSLAADIQVERRRDLWSARIVGAYAKIGVRPERCKKVYF